MPQQPPPPRPDRNPYPEADGRPPGVPPQGRPTPPAGAVDPWVVGGSGRHASSPPPDPGHGGSLPGRGQGWPGATPPDGSGAIPPGRRGATPPDGSGAVPPGRRGATPPRGTGPVPPARPAPGGPTQAFGPAGPASTTATPTTATPASGAATAVTATSGRKGDLTVSKILGASGAAAASAVAGSFFGAMGTVSGAAAGAVFSSVVTEMVQRSYDRTRDTVKARIKLPGGRTVDVEGKTDTPAPVVARGGEVGTARVTVTPGDAPTELIPAVAPRGGDRTAVLGAPGQPAPRRPRSRRRLLVMTGFTAVVFALAMLAITGLELVKGSPLNASRSTTAEAPRGTSLGSVLGGGAAATESSETSKTSEPSDEDGATTSARRSKAPAEDDDSGDATSSADADQPSAERTRGGEDAPAPTASRSPRVAPTPTAEPGSGGGGSSSA